MRMDNLIATDVVVKELNGETKEEKKLKFNEVDSLFAKILVDSANFIETNKSQTLDQKLNEQKDRVKVVESKQEKDYRKLNDQIQA